MNHPEIDDILIHEDHFTADMKTQAEPYLAARRKELTLFREEGHPIHCVRYSPNGLFGAAQAPCAESSAQGSAEGPARDSLRGGSASAPSACTAVRGVIVMSHGFTETTEKYRELICYFLRCGFAVSIHDHCGHGRSYRLSEDASRVHIDTWERYRDDLLCAAHAARDEYPSLPLYLFGHSMGGGIAAAAAAAEPSLFAKVILSSPMIRPTSGGVPWFATRFICAFFCAIGREQSYAPGQGPYRPGERFEDSAASSEPRFQYYKELRDADPALRMGGATYGWMNASVKLSTFLLKEGWQAISCPVLLLQADHDDFVMNAQQGEFMEKLRGVSASSRLVHLSGTKHELFNSRDDILAEYLALLLDFLN